jgi:hypothetical protein
LAKDIPCALGLLYDFRNAFGYTAVGSDAAPPEGEDSRAHRRQSLSAAGWATVRLLMGGVDVCVIAEP